MSRRHQAPRNSSPPRPYLSPSNPFASLDPALHPSSSSAGGGAEGRDPSPSLSANRLTDFAQHVLGGAPLSLHGHEIDGHDAENLLAFGEASDEYLRHPPQFGDLLHVDERHMRENGLMRDQHGDFGDLRHEEGEGEGEAEGEGSGGRPVRNMRKRKSRAGDGDNADPLRTRKDNHKEVERRRRETINDGMTELAELVPGTGDKLGKSALLRRTAQYLKELVRQVETIDEDRAKWDQEKADLERELSTAQGMLQEEHSRSLRFETTWREAEDRAAASQFELERVKGELEALQNGR